MRTLKHKYNAKKTEVHGKKFPSKMEARYYAHLMDACVNGNALFFLRQVPFDLPGNVTYRADFMVFWVDGTVEVIDVKGMDTPVSKIKRKQVEDLYPITIKVVTKC